MLGCGLYAGQRLLGRIRDMVVQVDERLPQVSAVMLEKKRYLPWSNSIRLRDGGKFALEGKEEDIRDDFSPEFGQVMLRAQLLDRQIVDTAGAKVVRVNDLQLISRGSLLLLNKVDVGFSGLLRRAKLLPCFNLFTKILLESRLQDNLIPWNFVQAMASEDLLRLKLSQSRLTKLHPADLADIIEDLDQPERERLFKALDIETAADILEETEPKLQLSLIETVPDATASDILDQMSPDEAADILQSMDQARAEIILQDMELEQAKDVRTLLRHDQESAGGLMTTDYFTMEPLVEAAQAIAVIKRDAADKDVFYYVYVTDQRNLLLGVVSLRDLILAPPEATLASIMTSRPVYAQLDASVDEVADMFVKYGLRALPVLDADRRLRGVLRLKAMLEAVAQFLK
jgi:CBS domain-containing protein